MKKISEHGLTGKKLIYRGIFLFLGGILLILLHEKAALAALNIFLIYLFLIDLLDLFLRIFKKSRTNKNLLVLIVEIIVINRISVYNLTAAAPYLIAATIALYQVFMAFINLITYFLYVKDNIKPRDRLLFDGIWLTFIGSIGLIFLPSRMDNLMFYLGLFFCFYGYTTFRDGFFFEDQIGKNNLKRKTRVSLPLFLTALIPLKTLLAVNKFLAENSDETSESAYNISKDNAKNVNFEIFIHTSEDLIKALGHVDICYRGKVYGFGHYDLLSNRFFTIMGDGVLLQTSRDEYIEFCKKEDKKAIMAYGLHLSPSQLVAVEERLSELMTITYP